MLWLLAGVIDAAKKLQKDYPLLMAAWKVAPALASGCSLILKPSELSPLSALLLAAIAEAAGVPSGVFNVVVGAGAVGAALATGAGCVKASTVSVERKMAIHRRSHVETVMRR